MKLFPFKNRDRKSGSETLWNRSFIFLNLSFFLAFTNISFFYIYPLSLDDMGIGPFLIGFVMGLFSIAAVIIRPFFGKMVLLKGEFIVISMGLILSFVSSLGYILITAFGPGMLIIRVVHGIGFSAFIAGGFSFAARTFNPLQRAEAFGILGAFMMAAIALAPSFGEFLVRRWGFDAMYMAAAASLIMALAAACMIDYPLSSSYSINDKVGIRYFELLKNRSYLFLLISTFIFAHCQCSVTNFLALIADEKGVTSGRFFFTSFSTAILILITMGRFIDRHGKLFIIRLSYPLFCLGILLIPAMIKPPFFLIPAVLYGVGMGLLFPTHNALAADHGSRMDKPAIMSLFTAVYDSGFVTGTILSGWYVHKTSLDTLIWSCGILAALGFLLVVVSPIKEG